MPDPTPTSTPTPQWQRARVLPNTTMIGAGRLIWVRIGPPENLSGRPMVDEKGKNFLPMTDVYYFETHLFENRPFYLLAKRCELLPRFAIDSEVTRERMSDFLMRKNDDE